MPQQTTWSQRPCADFFCSLRLERSRAPKASRRLHEYFARFPRVVWLVVVGLAAVGGPSTWGQTESAIQKPESGELRWWKGNLHTHSFWSDGNDFPEMIARWYADRDYNFLALTDHNILSRGEKWISEATVLKRGGDSVLPKYRAGFGDAWVELRQNEKGENEIRLKGLVEFRGKIEQPGKFLLIEGEEISDSVTRLPLHLNATNLQELLPPVGGATMREAMRNNLRAAQLQEQQTGQPILVHLNHPNFGWALTAEDIAAVPEERFIEVFNGHPSVNQLGDSRRASIEEIWDIANTLRLGKLNELPLFGLGTDDSHNYHGEKGARPGRAWVMVRSPTLDPQSLIRAMYSGDFYASSGVTLRSVEFNPDLKKLQLEIEPRDGVTYETKFIGTRRKFSDASEPRLDDSGNPLPTTRKYSIEVGEILATVSGLQPGYQLTGAELYVRAVVTASTPHPDPSYENQFEQAWTQPVGWEK